MGNSDSRPARYPFQKTPCERTKAYVWRCNIPGGEGYECDVTFHTAPDLRRHYRDRHRFTTQHVSRYQNVLMLRLPRPPNIPPEEIPASPTVRQFIRRPNYDEGGDSGSASDRSAGFDPSWPIGPREDRYGQWVVRSTQVGEPLEEVRRERERRNPRGWERIVVPDWIYDDISRRVRMKRGKTFP